MVIQDLFLQVPAIPNVIKWFGTLTAVLAAGIAAYKFLLQRPNLQLEVEMKPAGVRRSEGRVITDSGFFIRNTGRKFAEDVFLEISLDSWKFGSDHTGVSLSFDVSPTGSLPDEDEKREEDSDNSDREYFGEISFADSNLTIDHDYTDYIESSGEVNQIFIEEPIYNGAEFRLFNGPLHLDHFEEYSLEYEVSCRSYGPKKGEIKFKPGYDSIEVKHDRPSPWWALFPKPWWSLRQWMQSVKPSFLESPSVAISSGSIDFTQDGFYTLLAVPRAIVQVSQGEDRYYSVDAKATLYIGEKQNENIVGTLVLTAYFLEAGETWEIKYGDENYQRMRGGSDYRFLNGIPLVLSPLVEPFPQPGRGQFQVDWSVDYDSQEPVKPRGVDFVDDELEVKYQRADGTKVFQVTGWLENSGTQNQSVSLVIKFYDATGYVVATAVDRREVEAGGSEFVRLGPEFYPNDVLDEHVSINRYEPILDS